MILRGCGCWWNCRKPIGKHMASGLSRAFNARRCFLSSAAHGVYGRPPSMLPPASKKVATGGTVRDRRGSFRWAAPAAPRLVPAGSPAGPHPRQEPLREPAPRRAAAPAAAVRRPALRRRLDARRGRRHAAVRCWRASTRQRSRASHRPCGARAAVICGRPCASRGTGGAVGSGIFGHWAATVTAKAATPITTRSTFFIGAHGNTMRRGVGRTVSWLEGMTW